MAVSKRLRYEILRRDSHACRYCGATAPNVELTVDHVIPSSLGGRDEPSNLVAACCDCNNGKASSAPDAPVVADTDANAARWAQALATAAAARVQELAAERSRVDPFDAAWQSHLVDGKPAPRHHAWRGSVLRFLACGVSEEFIDQAVSVTMTTKRVAAEDKWRYFCGMCWREADSIRTAALKIAPGAGPTTMRNPYKEAVEYLCGVFPDLDHPLCRQELAERFDEDHADDEAADESPITYAHWSSDLRALVASAETVASAEITYRKGLAAVLVALVGPEEAYRCEAETEAGLAADDWLVWTPTPAEVTIRAVQTAIKELLARDEDRAAT